MAGHSEWSNIKHRKEKQDKKKAKKFGKLTKEIIKEARKNPDPNDNPTLAGAIERAKEADMPKENIERALKKAKGELEGQDFQTLVYEGYGPDGVAVLIKAETDNRNRTSSYLKNTFEDFGGELGDEGCVRWIFERKGLIKLVSDSLNGVDEDTLQLEAIEAGAEDIEDDSEEIKIFFDPEDLKPAAESLKELVPDLEMELVMSPKNFVEPGEDAQNKVESLMEKLRENRDVDRVFHNCKSLLD
ncbi:MAG: YebC/PmpR family DNA-binding transcriptional regulator [Candidatus Bipolaricaulota bacterium]|nr:YebC/PmpR family DNA-binding transcriptional regulator [Candidatus Bipolaricaulota bacterium]MBS3791524.1 YebC/PmpR family DNA-binding transcriptional regulator [Candidatus Bipolaricaulota bacterium]